jgi:uncharacterized protein YjbI with pentapeptide repeats
MKTAKMVSLCEEPLLFSCLWCHQRFVLGLFLRKTSNVRFSSLQPAKNIDILMSKTERRHIMADQNQVERIQQGAAAWNTWRKQHPDVEVDLRGANLRGANLSSVDLREATLSSADLRGANLRGANLSSVDLREATLSSADLRGATLSSADLRGVDLYSANLSDATLIRANLTLSSADLREANLSSANFSRANLSSANLRGANLVGANLSSANLVGADLSFAHLSFASLSSAKLSFASLSGADLYRTNLSDATIGYVTLADLDLCSVQGLIEIRHVGPSFVSLHSVQLPQDGSALHFLRGAGIPDEWIDFYRSAMMQPIQYWSVFISYSSDDESLSKRLYADLQANGVRCWFAPHDLKPGDFFRQEIDKAIHLQDKLLLILSKHSIQSNWVEYEVNRAIDREISQKRTILFPIRVDKTVLPNDHWAADIRSRRHIGNFTNWKDHTTYQRSFDQLLKQLKADTP